MSSSTTPMERLMDLLADDAGGEHLSSSERHELTELGARFPEVDAASFEHAAAALHLALIQPHVEPLPGELRERLLSEAPSAPTTGRSRANSKANPFASPWLGWLAAAAAVAFFWLQPRVAEQPPAGPTLAELERASDLLVSSWSATEDPGGSGVTGEVLWSGDLQAGVMKFTGLAANDPSEAQYQLWIFDAERPADSPVDGGVFDANGGETVVPIDAKIAVASPTLFAITLERPGGVVVSTRERLLLTSTPQ